MKLVSFSPVQMKVAFTSLILSGLSSLTAASAFSDFLDADHVIRSTTCEEIEAKVSSESVVYYNGAYFPSKTWQAANHKLALAGSTQYEKDNYHWSSSSSQASECSFEPATVQDVGIAVRAKQASLTFANLHLFVVAHISFKFWERRGPLLQ
jgi:hypothetical protein